MPPLTPEQLGELSVRFEKLTRDLEEDLLRDIARRIAKAGTVTDTAEYQILRMKEMGYATDYIEKALAEYTEKSEQEIEQIFFDAGQCSDEFYSRAYAAAGKPFRPVSENPYMQQLIRAGIEQTKGELHNYTRSMGFSERGPDGSTRFKPAAKAYQDALDLAHMQVASGVFDYNTAVRNATRPLTDSGLRYVDYASGHVNHADVAVRRAVLTGVSQMTGKIAEHNMKELGTDLVEVTAHAGARPDHAVWQGKWYSYSGSSKKYPSLAEATKYGRGDGLKGWNCRHDFYPVIEGIDTPAYTEEELRNIDPPPIEYNGRTYTYYECTQKQRQMETAMRKTKREVAAAQGAGDNEMFTVKSILLRRQREEYAKFSDRAGLLTQNERHQVYGFDRSLAAKSTAAAKKALDKSAGSGIIKAGSGSVHISAIEQPIESRNTSKGNPNAILLFDEPLNNRQQQLLDKLPDFNSRVIVPKKSVSMADLSALTAKTDCEYAMFTKGNKRLIVRGNKTMVDIGIDDAKQLSEDGYKWSGHTHPGTDFFCLEASDGDYQIFDCFKQNSMVIYNSKGQYRKYDKE